MNLTALKKTRRGRYGGWGGRGTAESTVRTWWLAIIMKHVELWGGVEKKGEVFVLYLNVGTREDHEWTRLPNESTICLSLDAPFIYNFSDKASEYERNERLNWRCRIRNHQSVFISRIKIRLPSLNVDEKNETVHHHTDQNLRKIMPCLKDV